MTWTDERCDTLRRLWADGLSCSEIAAELRGVTRNAVIGKVNRLGLEKRRISIPPYERKLGMVTRRKAVKPKFNGHVDLGIETEPDGLTDLPPDTSENPVTLMELTDDTCRWPLGDPQSKDFRFCGDKPGHGPYCQRHAHLAYAPAPTRRVRYWNHGYQRKAVTA
jgi:GcrA cell cycle regulator